MHFISFFFLLFSLSYASTPYELGKELYMKKGCYGCHGRKAEGMHNYPRLANRAKGYLSYKLENYRKKISNTQQQEMMVGYALDLSDSDIQNLSLFLNEFVDEDNAQGYDYSFETHGDGGS